MGVLVFLCMNVGGEWGMLVALSSDAWYMIVRCSVKNGHFKS